MAALKPVTSEAVISVEALVAVKVRTPLALVMVKRIPPMVALALLKAAATWEAAIVWAAVLLAPTLTVIVAVPTFREIVPWVVDVALAMFRSSRLLRSILKEGATPETVSPPWGVPTLLAVTQSVAEAAGV